MDHLDQHYRHEYQYPDISADPEHQSSQACQLHISFDLLIAGYNYLIHECIFPGIGLDDSDATDQLINDLKSDISCPRRVGAQSHEWCIQTCLKEVEEDHHSHDNESIPADLIIICHLTRIATSVMETKKMRGEITIYGEKWSVRSKEERSPEARLMILPEVALASDF